MCLFYIVFDMWKINREKLVSLIKVGIIWFGLLFWIFFVFFAIPLSVIENEKILDIYIPSVILVILLPVLVILYYSCIAYKNNKPKYIDWKYVWKDWRVYEWDRENGKANWKWKFTRTDWFCYEWEFKDWKFSWKWKSEVNWTVLEWTRVDWFLEWKWKLVWHDWWYYEWEFKKGEPHWMWIIKMKNWYYYEGELKEWRRIWKFKKEILSNWTVIEWEFMNNWNNSFEWVWREIFPDWSINEWIFYGWVLQWEWKFTAPNWEVLIWTFDNWELKEWKKILKNWEYVEWNWANWFLTWMAKYYFKDGSYYEWEYWNTWWQWIWTYVTKKWDKYPTEFPYEIINVFMYWLNSKIKEIQWNLNYIPKTEKEKADEKNMYLEILKNWTDMQKEIVKLLLKEEEQSEILLNSLKTDNSVWNLLKVYTSIVKLFKENRKRNRNITNKYDIKPSKKKTLSYSYWQFSFRLDWGYSKAIDSGEISIKIFQFLNPKNILDFVTKREKKNKEWVILIDEFSEKYKLYIQTCLDWREYEKKFWKRNFKLKEEKE